MIVEGAPPKIVWVRLSDAAVRRYADLLRENVETIMKFLLDSNAAYIEVTFVPLA